MNFIKKATLLVAIPVIFLIQKNDFSYADENVIEPCNLKTSDIKTNSKFESDWFFDGVYGTTCCVEIDSEEPKEVVYQVGALITSYVSPGLLSSLKETVYGSFTDTYAVTTSISVSLATSKLLEVGASILSLGNAKIDYGASVSNSCKVEGSFTSTYSHSYTKSSTIEYEYDINSIDKTKESVALGYVIKGVRFKVKKSYKTQNKIFRGKTILNDTIQENYYAYVYTYMYKTWIYENGKYYGEVNNIHEIYK